MLKHHVRTPRLPILPILPKPQGNAPPFRNPTSHSPGTALAFYWRISMFSDRWRNPRPSSSFPGAIPRSTVFKSTAHFSWRFFARSRRTTSRSVARDGSAGRFPGRQFQMLPLTRMQSGHWCCSRANGACPDHGRLCHPIEQVPRPVAAEEKIIFASAGVGGYKLR